jgi:hypothetical protein
MRTRSSFVQLRVTPHEKAALRQLSRAAGQDLTSYVLSRALPANRLRFQEIVDALAAGSQQRYALAELNDFLTGLAPMEFLDAVEVDLPDLGPFHSNYVAAMVEQAAHLKGLPPPAWTSAIAPLEQPYFGSRLRSHRLHLLRASPVPFRRRNLFIDASIGARV